MKILWLSHLVPYPATGIGVLQRSHNLLRELAHYHELHLVSFIQPSLLETAFGSVQEGLNIAREALSAYCRSVEFVALPATPNSLGKQWLALQCLFRRLPYSVAWLSSKEYRQTLARLCSTHRFDLAHYDTISLAKYRDTVIARFHSLNHHNIESHMMLRRAVQEHNPAKKAYFALEGYKLQRFEISHARQFGVHLTCSALDADRLHQIVPDIRSEVIPNGVDINYFQPMASTTSQPQLVFAGGLDWYPNADAMRFFANEIWPLLKRQRPDLIMNLIGRQPPSDLQALAEKDPLFRVHGFVSDVRPYIAQSEIYVCPIRDGGGTKLKILDALAMGKALVAHPAACEGIPINDGCEVLFAESPEDFTNNIMWLLDHPEDRSRMERDARLLACKHFSYTSIGRQLADLYESLQN